MQRKSLGGRGEALAKGFLTQNGYQILHSNWRYGRYGEVDIIAYHPDKQLLAFVEVKTRRNHKYGSPLEAVTVQQQNKIRTLAEVYVATAHLTTTYPFSNISCDLITVEPDPMDGSQPLLTHYPCAF